MPEPPPENWGTWTVGCRELYHHYQDWLRQTPYRSISPEKFLEVLLHVFPQTGIIELRIPPYKFFEKIRRTYPPTEADYERMERQKQMELRFQSRFKETDGSDGEA